MGISKPHKKQNKTNKIMKLSICTQICVLLISTQQLVSSELDQSGDSANFEITNTNEIEIINDSLNVCENISCPNPPCQFFCDADRGFYPDSRNCKDYCECSGHPKTSS